MLLPFKLEHPPIPPWRERVCLASSSAMERSAVMERTSARHGPVMNESHPPVFPGDVHNLGKLPYRAVFKEVFLVA